MKTLLLACLLALVGCGKKAKDNGMPSSTGNAARSAGTIGEQFITAIEINNPRTAETLLRQGANPNVQLSDGSTPLTYSITRNNASLVDVLLRAGADPEKTDKNGETPLFLALKNKNDPLVRMLVVYGADINDRDARLRTPLIIAVVMEEVELAEWLIERGADINLRDNRDRDALSIAREMGLSDLATTMQVRILTVRGGSDEEIVTGLFEREDIRALREFLLRRPQVIKLKINPGLLERSLALPTEARSVESLGLLLGYGMNVEGDRTDITTPLILAAKAGKVAQMRVLVKNGANIEAMDESDKTPLIAAITTRQLDVVRYLLEQKAEKNYETTGANGRVKHQSCIYGRQSRDSASSPILRKTSEDILKALGCGLRGFFS
jgi:ankyrin repeat protein